MNSWKIVILLMVLIGFCRASEVIEKKDLTWINLQATNGDVTIENSETSTTKITVDKSRAKGDCKYELQQIDSEFIIDGLQNTEQQKNSCFYSFTLHVPKDVYPSIMVGEGSLKSSANLKQLRFTTGKGNIEVNGEIYDIELGGKDVKSNVNGTFNKVLLDFEKGTSVFKLASIPSGGKFLLNGADVDYEVIFPRQTSTKAIYNSTQMTSTYKFKNNFEIVIKTQGSQLIKVDN